MLGPPGAGSCTDASMLRNFKASPAHDRVTRCYSPCEQVRVGVLMTGTAGLKRLQPDWGAGEGGLSLHGK